MPETRRARARARRPVRGPAAADCPSVLERLATDIESAMGDDWEGANELVRVRFPTADLDDPDGVEVGFAPIDGDVGDRLTGLRAADAWDAIGVVVFGWYRLLDDAGQPGERAGHVRSVQLLHRDGTTVSIVHRRGEDAQLLGEAPEGRVADLLRRTMRLPTPPPVSGPVELFAVHWLIALLGAEPGSLRTWDDVASRNPLLGLPDDAGATERATAVADLPRLIGLVERTLAWERARKHCARGELALPDIDQSVAAWFDEGSFARCVLGSFPPIDVLCDAVAATVPEPVAAQLRATLQGWGLGGDRVRT